MKTFCIFILLLLILICIIIENSADFLGELYITSVGGPKDKKLPSYEIDQYVRNLENTLNAYSTCLFPQPCLHNVPQKELEITITSYLLNSNSNYFNQEEAAYNSLLRNGKVFNTLASAYFFLDTQDAIIGNRTLQNFEFTVYEWVISSCIQAKKAKQNNFRLSPQDPADINTQIFVNKNSARQLHFSIPDKNYFQVLDENMLKNMDQEQKQKSTIQKIYDQTVDILLKFKKCLDHIFKLPNFGVDAQKVMKEMNSLTQYQRNTRNLRIQRVSLQNQFDLIYPNSQILVGQQLKFQFFKFGEGFLHEIQNIKRIAVNNKTDLENDTLPRWLQYDKASRIFRGKVPEEENKIIYEITMKFSSGINNITDRFLFHINKNIGISAFELVGSIKPDGQAYGVSRLEIEGKIYALVASYKAGLNIIDVSDPQNPVLVGSKVTGGIAYAVTTLQIGIKIYALVADGRAGLKIIEVTDPQNPSLVGNISTSGDAYGVDTLQIKGKIYALVANNNAGLQIIEVSDPQQPVLVENISTGGDAQGVSTLEINGKMYALVASLNAGLKIINVSNPQKPFTVGQIRTSGYNYGVSTQKIGGKIYALLADGQAGLKIIKVSDPQKPLLIGNISTVGYAIGVSTLEIGVKIYALVANYDAGLKIIEVSDPQKPVLVGNISTGGYAWCVSTQEIRGKIYALLASHNAGLKIIQIKLSNYQRNYFLPISYSKIFTGGYAYGVSTREIGGKIYALVTSNNAGLEIIEVSDPQKPVLVGNINTGGKARGVSTRVIGAKIYVLLASLNAGLKIIEVSDPQNPLLVGNLSTIKSAIGVSTLEIKGKIYALVASDNAGLKIIEVSDPQNPLQVGSIKSDGQAYGISTLEIGEKIYALLASLNAGLQIIEVSDPQNPLLVGNISTSGSYGVDTLEIGIKIYALVASDNEGLKIIDVSDPQKPSLVGNISTGGDALRVSTIEILGKIYALVASHDAGIQIIGVSDPQKPDIVDTIKIDGLARCFSMLDKEGTIYALVVNQNPGYLQIIKITDDIILYPSITSTINQQIRKFKINLYPINTNTLNAFSEENILLSLSLIKRENKQLSPFPYWLYTNIDEKTMNFVPISKESLELIRYIHYTLSTKVKSSDLDGISNNKTKDMVINELICKGYLDTNLFLTKSFNINKDLTLDPSFNQSTIKEVLLRQYHAGYFEMTTEDFLELSNSPKIEKGELQRQFNAKVESLKVTKKIDFQFSDSTFTHPDELPLTYSITKVQKKDAQGNESSYIELPVWLSFDKASRRFQGIPEIEDLGVYQITVEASDKFKQVSQNFNITLINHAPTVQEEIPDQFKILKLGNNYDYIFSQYLFKDEDNDPLTFNADIIYTPKGENKNLTTQSLISTGDFWMKFDSKSKHFTGKPKISDIYNNSEGYNQNFTIRITATDIANASVSKEYDLKVQKQALKVHNSIKNQKAKIQELFTFQFDKNTFNIGYDDNLIYEAEQTNGRSLPQWLTFMQEDRKFEGTPPDSQEDIHVRLIANDDEIYSVSDEFELIFEKSPLQNAIYLYSILMNYWSYGAIILSLYSFYKLRAQIYEFCFQKYYQYFRIEKAIVGQEYNKKIRLIREDIVKANKLWDILQENTIIKLKSRIIRENSSICKICWQYLKLKFKNNWFESEFMNELGEIKQQKLAETLNQTNIQQPKKMQLTIYDLKRIIDGKIANMLIEINKSTKKIYETLKKNSSNFYNEENKKIYSQLDWYIEYIKKPQNNIQLNEDEIIQIDDDILEKKLSQLNIKDDEFNKKLLIDKILSDAGGISEISRLQSSKGETIHVYYQEIKTVKAKQEIKNIIGLSLGKRIKRKLIFLKLNYVDIEMIDNRKLPKWLNVEIEDNTLHLWGTPKKEDKKEIMIQILDHDNFVLREFWIKVYENQEQIIKNQRCSSEFYDNLSAEENIDLFLIPIN